MADTATPYMAKVMEYLDTLPAATSETRDWMDAIRSIDSDYPEWKSLAYMRVHLALAELATLIGLQSVLTGRQAPLVQFYDFFEKQQAAMGDKFDTIRKEALSYARIEEGNASSS